MRVLWDLGSATISQIVAAVQQERDVSPQTIKTLLRRLIDKHLVAYAVDRTIPAFTITVRSFGRMMLSGKKARRLSPRSIKAMSVNFLPTSSRTVGSPKANSRVCST